ncbi:MAG: hypothetical protein ACHRXM_37365 [Isosphaerales bacterium]
MNSHLMFRPDLTDCILEDRFLLATPNLGVIILTQSGYALITPFPGANTSAAGSLGSSGPSGGSASSVSGVPIPTSLYVTGSGGISSLRPGNITGVPSLAGGATTTAATGVNIQVGSGANDTSSGDTSNPVSRNVVADPTQRPVFTQIGGPTSASSSPVLPPGQSYRDSAPVPPLAPSGVLPQTAPAAGTSGSGLYTPNPQAGAPTLGPFNRSRSMSGPRPGSLVPVSPMLPGNN